MTTVRITWRDYCRTLLRNAHASDEVVTAITDLKTAATTAPVDATCGARTVGANAWVSSKNGGNRKEELVPTIAARGLSQLHG